MHPVPDISEPVIVKQRARLNLLAMSIILQGLPAAPTSTMLFLSNGCVQHQALHQGCVETCVGATPADGASVFVLTKVLVSPTKCLQSLGTAFLHQEHSCKQEAKNVAVSFASQHCCGHYSTTPSTTHLQTRTRQFARSGYKWRS